ncbi:MAG: hypothetical protein GF418_08725 [Chitinivibrionales bacterium]|nr:hypothetical protein [Chitinivibrionales bacterium]MBD3395696.1 hypothetical protein [Chitinivibrionales bacterium]
MASRKPRKTLDADATGPAWRDISSWNGSMWLRVLVCVQLVILAWRFSPQLDNNGDNAVYVILSQSLTDGEGYRQMHVPGEPRESLHPPLFPLMLAAARALWDNLILAKIMVALFAVCATLLCYHYFKPQLRYLTLPFLILVVTSGMLSEYSTILMSEIPYVVLSIGALLLYDRSVSRPDNRLLFWGAIAASVLPAQVRGVGLSFTAAWIAGTLLTKRYRYAVAHAGVYLLAFFAVRAVMSSSDSYLNHLFLRNTYDPEMGYATLQEMGLRVWANMGRYAGTLVRTSLMPVPGKIPPGIAKTVSTIFVGLVCVGWLRTLLSGRRLLALYVFFYFGILCLWQVQWSGERFVIGILPMLYAFLLLGLEAVLAFFDPERTQAATAFFRRLAAEFPSSLSPRKMRAVWAVLACVAAVNLYWQITAARHTGRMSPDWRNYYSCADWARIHTPADAVIMSRKSELFYLRSRRKGLNYPYTHDVEKVIETMEKEGVTHVVHDNFGWTKTTAKYLYPAIVSHPDRFRIVYALKNPDTYVLEFLRDAPPGS